MLQLIEMSTDQDADVRLAVVDAMQISLIWFGRPTFGESFDDVDERER